MCSARKDAPAIGEYQRISSSIVSRGSPSWPPDFSTPNAHSPHAPITRRTLLAAVGSTPLHSGCLGGDDGGSGTALSLLTPEDLPGSGWEENDQEMFASDTEQSYEWTQDDEAVIINSGIAPYADADEASENLATARSEVESNDATETVRTLDFGDEGFGTYLEGVNGNQYESSVWQRLSDEVGAVRIVTWDERTGPFPVNVSIEQGRMLVTRMQ